MARSGLLVVASGDAAGVAAVAQFGRGRVVVVGIVLWADVPWGIGVGLPLAVVWVRHANDFLRSGMVW